MKLTNLLFLSITILSPSVIKCRRNHYGGRNFVSPYNKERPVPNFRGPRRQQVFEENAQIPRLPIPQNNYANPNILVPPKPNEPCRVEQEPKLNPNIAPNIAIVPNMHIIPNSFAPNTQIIPNLQLIPNQPNMQLMQNPNLQNMQIVPNTPNMQLLQNTANLPIQNAPQNIHTIQNMHIIQNPNLVKSNTELQIRNIPGLHNIQLVQNPNLITPNMELQIQNVPLGNMLIQNPGANVQIPSKVTLPHPEVLRTPSYNIQAPEVLRTSSYNIQSPEVLRTPSYNVPAPEVLRTPYPVQAEKTCSCRSPAPLVNPFLPAASPVSAWAPPTSNLLPPVQYGQSRSHFLRKIPIPPPTL